MSVETRKRRASTPVRQESQPYVWSSPSGAHRRGTHGAVVFLISVALIGAVGMLYLLQTNHVANLGYEMSRLQDEREAALVEQQQLSARIAEKQALTTVEMVAREDLGMTPIADHVFLDVTFPAPEPAPSPEPAVSKPSALERFWGRLTGTAVQPSVDGEGAPND
ncbi:hypothetical protein BH23CHL2_BH23CHL2_07160 [soil metagenome]